MGRFGRVLRRAERRLEAPEPERSRIPAEMAGDLEDLYEAYRERGLDPEEARRRAVRWLEPSSEAAEGLRAVHTPRIERLLRRLGSSTRGRVEVGAAALFSLAAAGAGVAGVLRAGILPAASPGVWAVAALGAAGLGAAAARGYRLVVRGTAAAGEAARGLRPLLAAAAGAGLAGLLSAGLRLTTGVAGPRETAAAVPWSEIAAASALATLGLSVALILALAWLLLRVRADAVRRAVARARSEIGEPPGGRAPGNADGRETTLETEATA